MANNFIYFEGAAVSKTRSGNWYRVDLEYEDVTIYVSEDDVATIISMYSDEDPNLISILFAKIKYAHKCRNQGNEPRARKMDNVILLKGICELLYSKPVEDLIEIFTELKWHEITRIFESDNPAEEMEKII